MTRELYGHLVLHEMQLKAVSGWLTNVHKDCLEEANRLQSVEGCSKLVADIYCLAKDVEALQAGRLRTQLARCAHYIDNVKDALTKTMTETCDYCYRKYNKTWFEYNSFHVFFTGATICRHCAEIIADNAVASGKDLETIFEAMGNALEEPEDFLQNIEKGSK